MCSTFDVSWRDQDGVIDGWRQTGGSRALIGRFQCLHLVSQNRIRISFWVAACVETAVYVHSDTYQWQDDQNQFLLLLRLGDLLRLLVFIHANCPPLLSSGFGCIIQERKRVAAWCFFYSIFVLISKKVNQCESGFFNFLFFSLPFLLLFLIFIEIYIARTSLWI